jgi:hypothetical protein
MHSLGIDFDGAVYAWGCGHNGQLGYGTARQPKAGQAARPSAQLQHSAAWGQGLVGQVAEQQQRNRVQLAAYHATRVLSDADATPRWALKGKVLHVFTQHSGLSQTGQDHNENPFKFLWHGKR